VNIELEPHQKQQHRDAELGKKFDIALAGENSQHRRATDNSDDDVGHDDGLAQKLRQQTTQKGQAEYRSYLNEGTIDHDSHAISAVLRKTAE